MKICLLIIFVLLTSCNQKTQNSSSTTVEDKKKCIGNDIASYVIFEKEMNPSNGHLIFEGKAYYIKNTTEYTIDVVEIQLHLNKYINNGWVKETKDITEKVYQKWRKEEILFISKDEHIDLMDYSFINIKSKALDL
ncbi:hypothetical protein NXX71_02885 [Bacteroides faecis]|nr:hypothetical protein [Bacteroides faecis]